MKAIMTAVSVFLLILSMTACSNELNTELTTEVSEISVTTSVSLTETTLITTKSTTVSSVSSIVSATEITTELTEETEETTTESSLYDYNEVELSMLEQAGNPDYHAEAAIPYVAWTEVNLQKTMYAISRCYGYEFALPEATRKMVYDAGCALDVIARTSTGYYRLDGDLYIPCDFLDSIPPEDSDPSAATSNAVYIPLITSATTATTVTQVPDP